MKLYIQRLRTKASHNRNVSQIREIAARKRIISLNLDFQYKEFHGTKDGEFNRQGDARGVI